MHEEARDISAAEEQDMESSGDLTTIGDALSKATRALSETQVRKNRTQVEIIQRQDELDQLLRQRNQNVVSRREFENQSVMEYMEIVKKNANMTCENAKIEKKNFAAADGHKRVSTM